MTPAVDLPTRPTSSSAPTPAQVTATSARPAFREIFAADLPRPITDVMAASPASQSADVVTLFQPSGPPARETIPSWYVVATDDRTIAPAKRFMADRADATTVEIGASHAMVTSRPERVADVIRQAKPPVLTTVLGTPVHREEWLTPIPRAR